MLEKLLAEIHAGGSLEIGALAARLNTSTQMVAALLEHLRLAGYIQDYSTCGDGCGGCNLKAACNSSATHTVRLWQSLDPTT